MQEPEDCVKHVTEMWYRFGPLFIKDVLFILAFIPRDPRRLAQLRRIMGGPPRPFTLRFTDGSRHLVRI